MGDLTYALKNSGADIEHCPVSPRNLAALIRRVDSSEISGKIAKTVFEEMCHTKEDPDSVIKRLGLVQMSDEAGLLAIIDKILEGSPKQVAEYRSGREKVFGYFVGQVMKETKGQANPYLVNQLLVKKLKG